MNEHVNYDIPFHEQRTPRTTKREREKARDLENKEKEESKSLNGAKSEQKKLYLEGKVCSFPVFVDGILF